VTILGPSHRDTVSYTLRQGLALPVPSFLLSAGWLAPSLGLLSLPAFCLGRPHPSQVGCVLLVSFGGLAQGLCPLVSKCMQPTGRFFLPSSGLRITVNALDLGLGS
jgi:hypothetical protein